MILKRLICGFKGHDPDPDDDLIEGIMNDPRNWLRRCKRCGRYVMHDGANSGLTVTLSESEAKQEAEGLRREAEEFMREIERISGIHKL